MGRRVFLVVLDSVGIGALPDAELYGDEGSNTLAAAAGYAGFSMPNMERLGLFDIEGVKHLKKGTEAPAGAYGRMKEASKGKDTTIGHWEIAGIISERPLPTFPGGFPAWLARPRTRLRHSYARAVGFWLASFSASAIMSSTSE